ncbi:MAG TPA: hypothetical protein VFA43_10890 [Gemmatimonadaceae bacterium]|nr:hypothetical protein [Gemmatimonadaceae bacterium]
MSPGLRKVSTTAHVTVSVGWLGSVIAFLVLSVVGLRGHDAEVVRGAYISMNLIAVDAIVPLALAALITGLIEGWISQWGLVRYYWVLVKLLLTLLSVALLVLHQFNAVAAAAQRVLATAPGDLPNVGRFGTQLVLDATLAVLVLLAMTALSVYKPQGLTGYGLRKLRARLTAPSAAGRLASRGLGFKVLLLVVAAIVVVGVAVHLTGMSGHGGIHHGH